MKLLLTIAGFDPTSGAGVSSDCLTAYSLGVYPMAVTSAITVQNHSGVFTCEDLPEDLVFEQLDKLLDDYHFEGIKIGMLGKTLSLTRLAEKLEPLNIPIIWDPVLFATDGYPLTEYTMNQSSSDPWSDLLSITSLLTPNQPEYLRLKDRLDHIPYLLKGGHDSNPDYAIDVYYPQGNVSPHESLQFYKKKRMKAPYSHGTGCTLSTAITAYLIQGEPMTLAIKKAKDYLFKGLVDSVRFEKGHGAIRK